MSTAQSANQPPRKPILVLDDDDDGSNDPITPATRVALEDAKVAGAAGWCAEIVAEITDRGTVELDRDDATRLAVLIEGYYAEGRKGITQRAYVRALQRQRAIAVKEMTAMLDFLESFGWAPDPSKPRYPESPEAHARIAHLFRATHAKLIRAHGYLYSAMGLATGFAPPSDAASTAASTTAVSDAA